MTVDFIEHELQYIALSIMGIVYISKIIWILRFKAMKERTPSAGNKRKAILFSYLSIAMPWTMESMRKKWYKWLEFGVFHIGVAISIAASFMIPELPGLMAQSVITVFQIFICLSFIILLIRLGRRLFSPVNRAISHPDDYFSLILMIFWFIFAYFSMPMDRTNWMFSAYFALTAILIAYVPFSKMSHYILWPFTRYYFGKHFGHRGVYPRARQV